jgi:hypothetical protein
MDMDNVLIKHWRQKAPTTSLDREFVDNVIYPAMKEFAEAYHTKQLKVEKDDKRYK